MTGYTHEQAPPLTRDQLFDELKDGVVLILNEEFANLNRRQSAVAEKTGEHIATSAMESMRFELIAHDAERQYELYREFMQTCREQLEAAVGESRGR